MKEEIKEKLKELADIKYQEFNRKLCPGTNNILGVRIPILRNYAKQLLKEYPVDILLKNIEDEYYEEIMLQGMLIGLSKEKEKELIFKRIRQFVPKIDNWAVCDIFCGGLKITKRYPDEMWEFIQKYLDSNQEFEIRFAVVMILNYYISSDYLERDFQLFSNIQNQGYYVKMAVAWAISVCLIKYYEETVAYLKECPLDKFTYNKAIQKAIESYRISKEQKEFLRKMKK